MVAVCKILSYFQISCYLNSCHVKVTMKEMAICFLHMNFHMLEIKHICYTILS